MPDVSILPEGRQGDRVRIPVHPEEDQSVAYREFREEDQSVAPPAAYREHRAIPEDSLEIPEGNWVAPG